MKFYTVILKDADGVERGLPIRNDVPQPRVIIQQGVCYALTLDNVYKAVPYRNEMAHLTRRGIYQKPKV